MNQSMSLTALALLIPCLPMAVAALLFLPPLKKLALRIAPWVPASALLLFALHGETVALPWLLLGARVGLDTVAAPLLLLATVAWTIAGIHARQRIDPEQQGRFFLFWLLSWTGNLCVFITLDAASFYAAYAMMSFSAYGLIIFYGRAADYRAGRIYLVMALMGEALILAGLFMLGSQLGNVAFDQVATDRGELPHALAVAGLFAAGFAVKMGMLPLHMWLPLAHPQAPVPASAVLSGVILTAGLMGWIRFLPVGADGFMLPGMAMLVVGLASAFFGVAIGLTQDRMKTLLAYSSISQMGLICALVGAALLFPDKSTGLLSIATLFALHHGLAKTALFLAVDTVKERPALARHLCWLPAIALSGAPLTSGALAKVGMKGSWPEALAGVEPLLLASSVATTLLMARFLLLLWRESRTQEESGTPQGHWLLLLLGGLTLPWLSAAMTASASLSRPFSPDYLAETLLPVLTGVAIAWLAWQLRLERWRPAIPPGDVINLPVHMALPALPRLSAGQSLPKPPLQHWLAHMEQCLSRMTPSLLLFLAALTLLLLLGLLPYWVAS
jgi:formate hydrogenlyase subunit 3/multisubunit Na+/H+ antiporter MnhD subunit